MTEQRESVQGVQINECSYNNLAKLSIILLFSEIYFFSLIFFYKWDDFFNFMIREFNISIYLIWYFSIETNKQVRTV